MTDDDDGSGTDDVYEPTEQLQASKKYSTIDKAKKVSTLDQGESKDGDSSG